MGWGILDPPSQDQLVINLIDLDHAAVHVLARDAWLQYVASSVQHRKPLCQLHSLDPNLNTLHSRSLAPVELARVLAIQESAFITPAQQSRFDLSQRPECSLCGTADSIDHWYSCPRFADIRARIPDFSARTTERPSHMREHLLVERPPYITAIRKQCARYPPHSANRASAHSISSRTAVAHSRDARAVPWHPGVFAMPRPRNRCQPGPWRYFTDDRIPLALFVKRSPSYLDKHPHTWEPLQTTTFGNSFTILSLDAFTFGLCSVRNAN